MATITGTDGDDWLLLMGTSAADTITGGLGNDTIHGRDGDDWILGGDDDDALTGGAGNDSIEGGDGDDSLTLNGGEGEGNDTLVGGAGNDYVMVWSLGALGTQYAVLNGGEGDDTISATGATGSEAEATGGAGQDTYVIQDSSVLTITDFAAGAGGDKVDLSNLLSHLNLLNYISLEGRGYVGGNPFVASGGFLRLAQSGADTLLQYDQDGAAGSSYGWNTAATLRNIDMTTLTAENFLGIAPDGSPVTGQVITGTALADTLNGWFFDDTISGGEGGDTLYGSGGNDWIEGGDEVAGGDLMSGDTGDDTLLGGAGNDSLYGGYGIDQVDGGAGNDLLNGGHGNDLVNGGADNDSLDGGLGDDLVDGGVGNDHLEQRDQGNDTLVGGDGNDTFFLLSSTDNGPQALEVHGGDGDDEFWVGEVLDGSGSVLASGGAGQDTYRLFYGDQARGLTITDFQAGFDGDSIEILGLLPYMRYEMWWVAYGSRSGNYEGGNPFAAEQGYFRLVQEGAHTLLQFDPDGVAGAEHDWHTAAVLQDVDASALTAANFGGISPDGSPIVGEDLVGTEFADQLQGWFGDDTLVGGLGDDSLGGAAGADLMEGGDGSDTLNGGRGGDTMQGGSGNDRLDGDAGDDILRGGEGRDFLYGVGTSNDTLVGGGGDDDFTFFLHGGTERQSVRAIGGAGNDFFFISLETDSSSVLLTGGAGQDTYYLAPWPGTRAMPHGITVTDFAAGAGGDLLEVSALMNHSATSGGFTGGDPFAPSSGYLRFVERGTDTLLQYDEDGAGAGIHGWHTVMRLKDVAPSEITFDNFAPVTRTGTDASERLLGGLNHDTLSGAGGNDTLDGGLGADSMAGGSGDDTLDGGLGADWMAGGSGHDRYYVDEIGDVVVELAFEGGDTVVSSVDWKLGTHLERLTLVDGAISGSGNALNNWITGNEAANLLNGRRGMDTMAGGAGDDRYRVDIGHDRVIESAGAGIDLVVSTASYYVLPDNVENGRIAIGGSADLAGNRMANVLHAGAGDNVIYGGDGIDTVSYADATAGVTVSLALFFEQETGGSGSDRLNDVENLVGSRFDDCMVGSAAANILEGGAGADALAGGLGHDVLVGGRGRDVFDFDAAADSTVAAVGRDRIADFSDSDRVDLSGIDAIRGREANEAFNFIGSEDFDATNAAGQLRYEYDAATGVGILYGSTDADIAAEFAIELTGVSALAGSNLIL